MLQAALVFIAVVSSCELTSLEAVNLKSRHDSHSVMKYMLLSLTCNFWFLKNWHFLIWGFGFGGFFFSLSMTRFVLVLKEKLRRKMMFHKKTKEMLNSVKSIMCT